MIWVSEATRWGLLAGGTAVLAEYLYRTLTGSWGSHLYLWVPIQMTIGYAIFRLVTIPHTSLLDAFVVFAFSTTTLRVLVTVFVLQDRVATGTWVALGLVILARVAQTAWGR